MSHTPKITRVARRIRDDEALALTAGKTIAKALDARGLLPSDASDESTWPWRAVGAAAGVARDKAGKITFDQALAAVDSASGPLVAKFATADHGEWERFVRALDTVGPIQIGSPEHSIDPLKASSETRQYTRGGALVAESITVSVTCGTAPVDRPRRVPASESTNVQRSAGPDRMES